jgi:hypothetical protein
MTRKISISTTILGLLGAAFAAVPAAADTTGTMPTPDTYLAQIESRGPGETEGFTTPDTYLAHQGSGGEVATAPLPTPDAYLAQRGWEAADVPSSPVDAAASSSVDGFDWLDAVVGGLVALALMLLAYAAARRSGRFPQARHERA